MRDPHIILTRLTSASETPGTTQTYSYDLAGNRTGVWVNGTRTQQYTYNAANQVTGWSYDAAGNLLSDGSQTYSYDALGRVLSVGSTTNQYNADGTLVAQTANSVTTRSTQDLAVPLSHILNDGTQRSVYGNPAERLVAQPGSSARTWYSTDALGSVRATLNDAGVPQGTASYDAWGVPETPLIGSFGFTGELQRGSDVWLRARWYGAGRGTFGGRDAWAGWHKQPYSLHAYHYSYSNPVSHRDPSGRCPAPPTNTDSVICIDLFIASPYIGPSLTLPVAIGLPSVIIQGLAVGDGRGFNPNSQAPPSLHGGSRAYLYLLMNACGGLENQELHVNRSYILGGFMYFGPYHQYEHFTARQAGNTIHISWNLLNGVSGFARHLQDQSLAVLEEELRYHMTTSSGAAVAYAAWKAAEWMIGLDAIDGSMDITYDTITKRYTIARLNRDPYPSLEVDYYRQGIFQYALPGGWRQETTAGPYAGLAPSAPRDTLP